MSDIGSWGYPRGQCNVLYIRFWSDEEFDSTPSINKDPTMTHIRVNDRETLISVVQQYTNRWGRPYDELRENEFNNPNIYSLRWYYNPEDRPTSKNG